MLWTEAAFWTFLHVFAHVCGQMLTFLRHYSTIWRDVSVFIKCDTIFRLFFFWKLPRIRTSKFCKVMREHTEGMVGRIIWVLLKIYLPFQQWQNFENLLRNDKVITMSLVYYFFGTQCISGKHNSMCTAAWACHHVKTTGIFLKCVLEIYWKLV